MRCRVLQDPRASTRQASYRPTSRPDGSPAGGLEGLHCTACLY
jgi:hypothetical protein